VNSKPVVALDVVSEDIQLVYDYFEGRLFGAGERFFATYFKTTDQIALNPWSFPVKFDDYHRAFVPRSNQAVYYFQEPERSVIVAVVDARRNPRLIRDLVRGRRESR